MSEMFCKVHLKCKALRVQGVCNKRNSVDCISRSTLRKGGALCFDWEMVDEWLKRIIGFMEEKQKGDSK